MYNLLYLYSADGEQAHPLWDFNQDTQTILRPPKSATQNGAPASTHHTDGMTHVPEASNKATVDTPTSSEGTSSSAEKVPNSSQLKDIDEMVMGKPDGGRGSFVAGEDSQIKKARDSVIHVQGPPKVSLRLFGYLGET